MATRYVWGKYSVTYTPGNQSIVSSYNATSYKNLSVCSDYELTMNGEQAVYTAKGSVSNSPYINADISKYPYMVDSGAKNVLLEAPSLGNEYQWDVASNSTLIRIKKRTSTTDFTSFSAYTSAWAIPSDLLGTVAANASNAYPNDGVKDGYYYEYKGSDSIDPTEVNYSKDELEAGESVEIQVTPANPTYGGLLYYQYQYSTDDGASWKNIGGRTTDTAKSLVIPSDATRFQARVVASDDYGFTSTTYVMGPAVAVSNLKAYIGVLNKARAINKMYVGVGGKAREVVHGYIGVNGKAKKFF